MKRRKPKFKVDNNNAVIYARYSSTNQREASIADQLQACEKYAAAHGLTVINTYCDHAMTGTNDNRPGFQQMIHDAASKIFSTVLVWRNDRFARNRYDSIINKRILEQNGVTLVSIMEPNPGGTSGELMNAIYEVLAEKYSKDLSENVLRGMYGNAEKCMANTPPTIGYKIENHKYVADPLTAPLVQQSFKMFAAGSMIDDVVAFWKSAGIPKSKNALYRMFRNERYRGVYIWDTIRVPGGMPKLIDDTLWNKVHARLAEHHGKPHCKPKSYLLSGKMICGLCGSPMSGEYATGKYGTYTYYACSGSRKHICKCRRVRMDLVEQQAISALYNNLFDTEVIDQLAQSVQYYLEHLTESNPAIAAANEKLKDTDRRLNNIVSAIESGISNEATQKRMEELLQTKKELQQEILSLQPVSSGYSVSEVSRFIQEIAGGNINDRNYATQLVNLFVTQLTLYPDYGIITFDATGQSSDAFAIPHGKRIEESSNLINSWRSGWDSNPRAADG